MIRPEVVKALTTWAETVTGWPVMSNVLAEGYDYGVVYEVDETPIVTQDDPGQYGVLHVTFYVWHKRLQTALQKANQLVQGIQDIQANGAGWLRGGVLLSMEHVKDLTGRFFVMVRIQFIYQEV